MNTTCDAAQYGGSPTMLGDQCRCLVCARCGHHTGNSHQGHFWGSCKNTGDEIKFHFCCPDEEHGCQLLVK